MASQGSSFSNPSVRQIGLVAAALVLVTAFIVSAYVVLRPRYQVLFRDLKPQDAATIVGELDREKVSYRLESRGTAILVPEADVQKVRLRVMTHDLPLKGTVGFELFNNSDLGVTEFAQKVNYQRALQGELARTIMSLDGVESARVHLVLPESTLFRRTAGKAKASVEVTTRDEIPLPSDAVRGIEHLVAAAVPDLEPSDVTVLDQRGAMVNHGAIAGGVIDDPKLEMKQELESYYAQKVREAIEPIVGKGGVLVSVDAAINFDQARVTQETTDSRSNTSHGESTAKGAPQPLPPISDAPMDKSSSLSDDAALVAKPAGGPALEHSVHRLEQIVSAPGSIRKLSVGLLLKAPIDASTQVHITELVAATIGLVPSRGDVISTFVSDRFARPAAEAGPSPGVAASSFNTTTTGALRDDSQPKRTNVFAPPWFWGIAAMLLLALTLIAGWLALTRFGPRFRRLSEAQRAEYVRRLRRLLAEEEPVEATHS